MGGASLNHPHICTLHDVGSQDGIDFLMMEHLEGETLAQRLTKGALPLEQALQTATQIADALDKVQGIQIILGVGFGTANAEPLMLTGHPLDDNWMPSRPPAAPPDDSTRTTTNPTGPTS